MGTERTNRRLRTTLFIETDSTEKFEECLAHAVQLARGHVIQMTLSLKSDPDTRYGVRTTRVRKRKASHA